MRSFFYKMGSMGWAVVHSIPKVVNQPSLWPELPRKNKLRRYIDNYYFRFVRKGICLAYNGMGLDLKGAHVRDVAFNAEQKFSEWTKKQRQSWTTIIDDKFLLHLFLKEHGIPTVPVVAHKLGGSYYIGCDEVSFETLQEWLCKHFKCFFVKTTSEMCGVGVYKITVENGGFKLKNKDVDILALIHGMRLCVFQPAISNHAEMRKINSSTLNTLRLNTCWNSRGEVELWDNGFVRVGHAGSYVDNFAAGGIAVGIKDSSGRLRDYGINHDSSYNYRLYDRHPDTGVVFSNFVVPRYAEAVNLVKRAQRLFPDVPCIGWDVCITDEKEKVCILEGNWNWGVDEIQMINGYHAQRRWEEIYRDWDQRQW